MLSEIPAARRTPISGTEAENVVSGAGIRIGWVATVILEARRRTMIEIDGLRKRLDLFQETINKIDDFFEYRNESVTDRKQVHLILNQLTESLKKENRECC